VQKGYGATLAICLESKALNKVDFPALGSPTIPIESDILVRLYHHKYRDAFQNPLPKV